MYVNGDGNQHGRTDLWETQVGISIITSNILGDMNIIMNIRGGVNCILKAWHYLRYKQLGNKMNVHVAPFTVGPRFRFFHYGDFIHIGKNAKIGSDFAVNQGVVLDAVKNIVIGNHVTLCPGVKVVKDVVIGNNVVVGTMSVVTHNIPDNAVAAGSPARVLRIKK